jgi:hypothetical protein
MSNAIVQALEKAAKDVGKAIEDAGKSVGKFFEDTAGRLRTSAKNLVEHDQKAAQELEKTFKDVSSPTVRGEASQVTRTASAEAGAGSSAVSDEIERQAQWGTDVRHGFHNKSTTPPTDAQFPPDYVPMQGKSTEDYLRQYSDGTWNKYGDPNWKWDEQAPNHGALNGVERDVHVGTGTVIDRYGESHGSFLSPDGTPYPQRGLPADNLAKNYHRYQVLQPLPAKAGVIAPAFGEPGLGLQYRLDKSVQWYIDNGYLREIN